MNERSTRLGIPVAEITEGTGEVADWIRATRLGIPLNADRIPVFEAVDDDFEIVGDPVRSTRLYWPVSKDGIPMIVLTNGNTGDFSSVPNTAGTLVIHGDATIPEQVFRKFDTVHIYPTGRLTNNGILICKNFINDGVFVDNGTTIKTKQ